MRELKLFHTIFFIFFLILVLSTVQAAAASRSAVMLIIDASGSMWGQIEGTAKITIAKKSLSRIIRSFPEDIRAGLIAYGHNRKADCNDVQTLIPLQPIDKTAMIERVQRLNAKGKTPISRAIQQAIEPLKSVEEETTIILVSDGRETCDSDPCAVARVLKESGIKFVLHVVGFDVSEEEREQLQCIADAGGGKYYSARNADQFDFAVSSAAVPEKKEVSKASGEGKVWFEKTPAVFVTGGAFEVHFEAAKTFHENAWLGIIPKGIPHGSERENDRHNFDFEYINKREKGIAVLTAPAREGDYEVRLHDSDDNGREVDFVGFTVKKQPGEIILDRTEYITGETMTFKFKAPEGLSPKAWVGTVPSNIPHGSEETNDKHDVNYVYLEGHSSGVLGIPVPRAPGRYDLRMHDSNQNGNEIAHASFRVEKAIGDIWLDREEYVTGQTITFNFVTPQGLSPKAWVGVVPSVVPHGSEDTNDKHDTAYVYLNGQTEGQLQIPGPPKPGQWDLRLHDTNKSGNEIGYVTFTVAMAQARLSLEKDRYMTGEMIRLQFETSPGLMKKAWIGLVPENVPHGSENTNDQHDISYQYLNGKSTGEMAFVGPSKPGQWSFRLHDTNRNGNEIATVAFEVVPCTGELTLSKEQFKPGEKIEVRFSVAAAVNPKAWVGLFPASAPHGSEDENDAYDMDYEYIGNRTSGVVSFRAPSKPGQYDFRLHDSNRHGNEIATVDFSVE